MQYYNKKEISWIFSKRQTSKMCRKIIPYEPSGQQQDVLGAYVAWIDSTRLTEPSGQCPYI